MLEALILEFAGIGPVEYEAVNGKLGIDVNSGEGDWPTGLLIHAAGTADNGAFVVTEVWSSREAQAAFMETRLGAALAAGGVTTDPRSPGSSFSHTTTSRPDAGSSWLAEGNHLANRCCV